MTYELGLTKKAKKNLKKVPKRIQEQVLSWLPEVISSPFLCNDGQLKDKRYNVGGKEYVIYKKRFGKYRVLYYVDEAQKEVTIFRISKREDVYKF